MSLYRLVGNCLGIAGSMAGNRSLTVAALKADRSRDRKGAVSGRALTILALAVAPALAQPGQPAHVQPSFSMQDSNLRPALPGALQGVGIDQRLNAQIPLDIAFRDDLGRTVPLSTFFQKGKPVLLAPVYYRCPMLCSQVLNEMASALKAVSLDPGKDFEVVAFSFDPKDTIELAAAKRQTYVGRYGRPGTANGWHFLTGDPANIKLLMDAVGFHYKYDPSTDQYAHASGIMVITPEGRLSKYFYGVDYSPRDIRLGLVEASHEKIGSPVDQALLFCYHYDPATGKYGAVAINMVRVAGGGFALICGAFLLIAFRHDWRSDKRQLKRAR